MLLPSGYIYFLYSIRRFKGVFWYVGIFCLRILCHSKDEYLLHLILTPFYFSSCGTGTIRVRAGAECPKRPLKPIIGKNPQRTTSGIEPMPQRPESYHRTRFSFVEVLVDLELSTGVAFVGSWTGTVEAKLMAGEALVSACIETGRASFDAVKALCVMCANLAAALYE